MKPPFAFSPLLDFKRTLILADGKGRDPPIKTSLGSGFFKASVVIGSLGFLVDRCLCRLQFSGAQHGIVVSVLPYALETPG